MTGSEHDRTKVARMEFQLALRKRGIADKSVLRAMDDVRRGHYVDPGFAESAYADQALPISCGQTISQPYIVAYMTELLKLSPHHRVLEIGTGSGYQAAVLSRLAREIVSVERFRMLAERARDRLKRDGYDNVEVVVGDGYQGAASKAPFDRILVTAAAQTVPDALIDQLGEGGIIVMPLGPSDGVQRIVRVTKTQTGVEREDFIAVRFVPMVPGQAREL